MPPTPNTDAYMILGYVVIISILSLYFLSFVIRFRAAHKDIEALSE
ncbi:MAG TPA: hypothetical protein PLZ51_21595 [Aggregatilineales bacterium]|nr:hypothetical protein [Aggregatilineales bacterium]